MDFRLTEAPRSERDRPFDQGFFDIDNGIREARDMELAKAVRDYVQKTLICPDEASCRLRVSVSGGNVTLRGTVPARERLRLEKIAQAVRGVRSLDLAGVAGKEQP